MYSAIMGRVLSKEVGGVRMPLLQTLPPSGHAQPLLRYATELLKTLPSTTPVSLDEFPLRYSGRKRVEYLAAAASLRRLSLSRRDARIKLFLKFEKDVRSDKPGRIPRCILPPSVRYIVETGRYVHPIESQVYSAIDQLWGKRVVSKGRNYKEVAHMLRDGWDQFDHPVSRDVDVSKMDQSFNEEIMSLFLNFVADCSSESEVLREYLMWTLRTKVSARCDEAKFSYDQVGTLSSGMTFTSLAGVFVVTAIIWLFSQHYGIELTIVDAGDDMTVIYDEKDDGRVNQFLAAWYMRFGLVLEVGLMNRRFEGIEFCQTHPVELGDGLQMVRNTKSAAVKDAVSLRPLDTPLLASAWLRACGQAGMACQGGAPIATARFRLMLRSADAMLLTYYMTRRKRQRHGRLVALMLEKGGSYEWFGHGMNNGQVITDAARISFERAFGVPPHVQRAIEEAYDAQTLTFDEVRDPQAHQMLVWDVVG